MANRLTFSLPDRQLDPSLVADAGLSPDRLPSIARSVASLLNARVADATLVPVGAGISSAPMPAAPFVWRDDGCPDWGAMWASFCDLALFGGPPHRPTDKSVRAMADSSPAASPAFDVQEELQRGIWETTNLESTPVAGGWLAIRCQSTRMADWLCAAILLENVEARSEGKHLLVPASRGFTLESEVKSVVTVVAKTAHYWEQHIAGI